MPINEVSTYYVIRAARRRGLQEHGREPTDEELSKALGYDVAAFEKKYETATKGAVSLNLPVGEDGAELIDFIKESA
jgi:RNA polymerase primary sigma factor